MINKEKYFIPQDKAQGFDGSILRFGISENELSRYQRDTFPTSQSSPSQTQSNKVGSEEEITIPVKEEKLDVNKKVEEKQVQITKEPIKETKTVEVQVHMKKYLSREDNYQLVKLLHHKNL